MEDLTGLQELHFAQNGTEAAAADRMKNRLSQDRGPAAAASSQSWVNWSDEKTFLGQPWDATKIPLSKLEQMRRDPILAFALMFVKVPLIRAPWYVKSSDPKIAAAVDACLRRVYGRFVLAYCNSFDFGFSPIVKRFAYEDKPDWTYIPRDNAYAEEQPVWTSTNVKPIVWKPFTALNPRRCQPHWDSSGKFNGIDFSSGQSGIGAFGTSGFPVDFNSTDPNSFINGQKRQADIPIDWALWATNDKDSVFGSYWGYPRIGHAYRFWWAYWYRFGVADRAFEKWGDPPVIVYHPDDPLAQDRAGNPINYTDVALALAESARGGANVAIPSTVATTMDEKATGMREWEITQMQSKVDFASIADQFRYLDIQKLRAVMVPEQALVEGEGGTSSRNVASTFGELFEEAQTVVKAEIDDHLNRWVIPQFVETNFGKDAARAEIVTTGFDQMDMDTMRTVLTLIGQRKLLSVVDERELAERMGIPTVSRAEMNKRLDELANEAAAQTPAVTPATTGTTETAGVTDTGLYYAPRERIVFSDRTTKPYIIERVDELPNKEGVAYFDSETRTMYVTKDADPETVKGYVLGLSDKKETSDELPDDVDLILSELKNVADKIDVVSSRDTNVHVDLQSPEQEDPTAYKTRRRVLERDADGLIVDVEVWKEPIERKDTD